MPTLMDINQLHRRITTDSGSVPRLLIVPVLWFATGNKFIAVLMPLSRFISFIHYRSIRESGMKVLSSAAFGGPYILG
ncbi:MAG: hypothetical protein HW384_1866 [Dehalococcoidia bacterium]|nr:hypothetical protein [Dehalococcoidia bacterium]